MKIIKIMNYLLRKRYYNRIIVNNNSNTITTLEILNNIEVKYRFKFKENKFIIYIIYNFRIYITII